MVEITGVAMVYLACLLSCVGCVAVLRNPKTTWVSGLLVVLGCLLTCLVGFAFTMEVVNALLAA